MAVPYSLRGSDQRLDSSPVESVGDFRPPYEGSVSGYKGFKPQSAPLPHPPAAPPASAGNDADITWAAVRAYRHAVLDFLGTRSAAVKVTERVTGVRSADR